MRSNGSYLLRSPRENRGRFSEHPPGLVDLPEPEDSPGRIAQPSSAAPDVRLVRPLQGGLRLPGRLVQHEHAQPGHLLRGKRGGNESELLPGETWGEAGIQGSEGGEGLGGKATANGARLLIGLDLERLTTEHPRTERVLQGIKTARMV
jgi:hypothetical protein